MESFDHNKRPAIQTGAMRLISFLLLVSFTTVSIAAEQASQETNSDPDSFGRIAHWSFDELTAAEMIGDGGEYQQFIQWPNRRTRRLPKRSTR